MPRAVCRSMKSCLQRGAEPTAGAASRNIPTWSIPTWRCFCRRLEARVVPSSYVCPGRMSRVTQSICQALNITPSSRAITSLPFHYSYGLSVLNTHLFMGASLVMTDESLTAASFWDLFRMMECQSFAGVPYSYEILRRLDVNKLAGSTLSVMTQAGGKLQRELIAYFHKLMAARDGLFFVMYGQTEATARISVLPPSFLPEKLGSVGIPIPEGSLGLKLDDSITREAKQRGELVYSGPNVMMGYAIGPDDIGLGDILAGTLYTGDLAHFDDDGFTYINGRMKRD